MHDIFQKLINTTASIAENRTVCLSELIDEAWFAVCVDGRILSSNRTAEEQFGFRRNLVLSSLHPELWQRIWPVASGEQKRLLCCVQIDSNEYILRARRFDSVTFPAGAVCSLEDKNNFELIIQEVFQFSHLAAELETIINSSHDGLWICDGNATVVRINPASERMNGIKAEDVVGKSMQELVERGVVDRSATLEAIRTRRVVHMLQRTKIGRKLLITSMPVFDKSGRIVRVVTTERDITEIEDLHEKLLEKEALTNEYREQILQMQLEKMMSRQIIARSPAMIRVLNQAIKAARVDSTVILLGESGVGKGLIAEMIHKYSDRSHAPFVKINCAALPDSLIESELFGYEPGAFTGAKKSGKPGLLELADGGTVLMDEVGELSPAAQAKLLHFLEDGCFTRVGGTKRRVINVRIIAATNRNLDDLVKSGEFRQDLYYRLHVIPIHIPPLRERPEDIFPLLKHYIHHFSSSMGCVKRLSSRALKVLLNYNYPGNVRELINLCERLVAMSSGEVIDRKDIPDEIRKKRKSQLQEEEVVANERSFREMIEDFERKILGDMLSRYKSQQKIAEALKVNQSTIARKLKKYGLNCGNR